MSQFITETSEIKFDIETFPNPKPNRQYRISHVNHEFTSVCPKTGLPDFGIITINYIPNEVCLELKSLKYYFLEFRNRGIFYEAVTNRILDDLVAACDPIEMEIVAEWGVRGGMTSVITADYYKGEEE
ncbi:MAG: preQ(1) synthase [Candidatus Kapaibacteriota bacterium]|jgi:7-cyano-7-deazaguanine reductase